jgi:hypothetical protein
MGKLLLIKALNSFDIPEEAKESVREALAGKE